MNLLPVLAARRIETLDQACRVAKEHRVAGCARHHAVDKDYHCQHHEDY